VRGEGDDVVVHERDLTATKSGTEPNFVMEWTGFSLCTWITP
jgi:hypothetical protein